MKSLIAVLSAFSVTAIIIAAMYLSSFQRNHTHDGPQSQQQSSQETTSKDNPPENSSVTILDRDESVSSPNPRQNNPTKTDNTRLQHYDHKAQIFMAVFTFLGLLVALAGLYMVYRTLIESKKASKTVSMATIAEFQPYIRFSKNIEFKRAQFYPLENEELVLAYKGMVKKCTAEESFGKIWLGILLEIENVGKTPMFSGTFRAEISMREFNKAFTTKTYEIKPRGTCFSYLGNGDEPKKVVLSQALIIDDEKHQLTALEATDNSITRRDISRSVFDIRVWVTFSDSMNESKRTFFARYYGRPGHEDGIRLSRYTETKPQTEDNSDNWEI